MKYPIKYVAAIIDIKINAIFKYLFTFSLFSLLLQKLLLDKYIVIDYNNIKISTNADLKVSEIDGNVTRVEIFFLFIFYNC